MTNLRHGQRRLQRAGAAVECARLHLTASKASAAAGGRGSSELLAVPFGNCLTCTELDDSSRILFKKQVDPSNPRFTFNYQEVVADMTIW
jgi:hypothetical protein